MTLQVCRQTDRQTDARLLYENLFCVLTYSSYVIINRHELFFRGK